MVCWIFDITDLGLINGLRHLKNIKSNLFLLIYVQRALWGDVRRDEGVPGRSYSAVSPQLFYKL